MADIKSGRATPPRETRGVGASRLPRSANIKLALLAASVLIVLGTLLYAHSLVTQLRDREYRVVKLFSESVKYYTNAEETPDDSLYRMIIHYARSSEVPVILTDRHDDPSVRHFNETNWNVPYDSSLDSSAQLAFLREEMREMDRVYHPIPVYFHDSAERPDMVTEYIHYGNSLVLSKIESLPYEQLLLGMVVVVIGYLSFSYFKAKRAIEYLGRHGEGNSASIGNTAFQLAGLGRNASAFGNPAAGSREYLARDRPGCRTPKSRNGSLFEDRFRSRSEVTECRASRSRSNELF